MNKWAYRKNIRRLVEFNRTHTLRGYSLRPFIRNSYFEIRGSLHLFNDGMGFRKVDLGFCGATLCLAYGPYGYFSTAKALFTFYREEGRVVLRKHGREDTYSHASFKAVM